MKKIKRKYEQAVLRQHEKNNVEYLTFPLIEETGIVKHLFSTRLGGVSTGYFGTMNLSSSCGDEPENVLENFRRISEVLEEPLEHFVKSKQTHTVNVRQVSMADGGKGILWEQDYTDVDGMVTNEPGVVLATQYADCVPLFFVDPVRRAIGLSHSGWRGTVNRMGQKTLEAMKAAFGTEAKDVICGIGPSICQDCYEVSEDVAEAFYDAFSGHINEVYGYGVRGKAADGFAGRSLIYKKENGKYQLNLWRANEMVLMEAGVPEDQIQTTDVCTCCNPEYLFSHRASQGRRGLLGAFLMLK